MFCSFNAKDALPPKNGSAQSALEGTETVVKAYLDAWESLLNSYAQMARTVQMNAAALKNIYASELSIHQSRSRLAALRTESRHDKNGPA